jgi:CheY-like chemotaxis protein
MDELRVLIVDDSSVMRASLSKMVAPISSSVLLASNGEEGLATALGNGIDLILSDVDMPDLDGIEMCRRLRQRKARRDQHTDRARDRFGKGVNPFTTPTGNRDPATRR